MQDTQSIAEKDARIAELEAELEKRGTKIATFESQLDWLRYLQLRYTNVWYQVRYWQI